MSINTNAKPETTKLRANSDLRPVDVTPLNSNQNQAELEISLPMLVILIVAFAGIVFAGYRFFTKKSQTTDPSGTEVPTADVTLSTSYLTIKGDEKAKYVFVEVSDFECPYCRLFSISTKAGELSTYEQIKQRYITTGVMKFGYAPYIAVPNHKPAATNETLGFYCAAAQGKPFEYHQKIFEMTPGNGIGIDGKGTEKASIVAVAKSLGLDVDKFTACYDKRDIVAIDRVQEQLTKELKTPWADKYGAKNFGTPAFAVCKLSVDNPTTCVGKAYVGARPYADMKAVIDTFLGADAPK